MSDAQRLNSLSRFRKTSDRLVLEEHGHCEVPAGCGGVVLRWRDPMERRLFRIAVYAGAERQVFVNGRLVQNHLVDFPIGRVVLAIHVPKFLGKKKSVFAVNATAFNAIKSTSVQEPTLVVKTTAQSAWMFTRDEPKSDAWKLPTGDDDVATIDPATWSLMVPTDQPALEYRDHGWFDWHQCQEANAQYLTVPEPGRRGRGLWVRHELEVPRPEINL